MTSSPSLPRPVSARDPMRTIWSRSLSGAPRGLALERERGGILAWDEKQRLHLFSRGGELQGQATVPGTLTAACCADDGSAYVAAGKRGEVWWLAPDLTPRWEKAVQQAVLAVALDPFGQYVAVTSARGGLQVFDRRGRSVFQVETARPLHHLAFVPEAPFLVGSADFGLITCFDLAGRLVWRDGLVAHCGSLSTNADGSRIVLACFTEGLRCYTVKGQNLDRLPGSEAYRLATLSFDGRLLLGVDLAGRLVLLDAKGRSLCVQAPGSAGVAAALSALGDHAVAALSDGTVVAYDLREVYRI